MLPVRCFTCGHVLANLELEYEEKMNEYDNDLTLNEETRKKLKSELIDKLLPRRFKKRYCCRRMLISYIDLIQIII